MAQTARQLIIFDCDGVLVDSEPISVDVLVDALGAAGVSIDSDEAYRRFLGRSLGAVIETARDEFGLEIDEAFLLKLRTDLYARFRRDLQPIPGVATALDDLQTKGFSWCVASSSQRERIELSLTVTGLIDRFVPNIFSASMVKHGKPAPDLFLYAAGQMQRDPKDCIVIEDSPAGIEAAQAAGMTVFAFTGGSHAGTAGHRDAVTRLKPDAVFDAMAELLHLIAK
ncbi:HAD family hydrolase [Agrobacterium sp. a22-2]|uniref:HAD family hydrolase n=1 Tax=Agrobacterium sp. a22-2 TaxID=2283840 RepID=UPI001448317F|nr:HAD family hydrolase [Agrobacterium sp. a22-2]NKN35614.1 HAD family hydrolase [Agrobacterium sp. a22-2]